MDPYEMNTVSYQREFSGGVWHTAASALSFGVFTLAFIALLVGVA